MDENELIELFKATNTAEPLSEGWPGLLRFGLAVAAAEREACAKLCEEGAELCDTEWANKRPDEAAELDAVALTKIICASKIRERSNE